MNNIKKLATWGTQDTGRKQTKRKTQHRQKDEQYGNCGGYHNMEPRT